MLLPDDWTNDRKQGSARALGLKATCSMVCGSIHNTTRKWARKRERVSDDRPAAPLQLYGEGLFTCIAATKSIGTRHDTTPIFRRRDAPKYQHDAETLSLLAPGCRLLAFPGRLSLAFDAFGAGGGIKERLSI